MFAVFMSIYKSLGIDIIETDLSFGFQDAMIIASASIPPSWFSPPIHIIKMFTFPYASCIIGVPKVSLTISMVLLERYHRAACVLIIKNCPAYQTHAIHSAISIVIPNLLGQGDDLFCGIHPIFL